MPITEILQDVDHCKACLKSWEEVEPAGETGRCVDCQDAVYEALRSHWEESAREEEE